MSLPETFWHKAIAGMHSYLPYSIPRFCLKVNPFYAFFQNKSGDAIWRNLSIKLREEGGVACLKMGKTK
jgi:hypothetical protein